MTYIDLQRKLHDVPFKPFRIRMVNSTLYEVLEPWMVMIGESSAIIATQVRKDDQGYSVVLDWRTVSISQLIEFSDIDMKSREREKKPA